jgi:hypothetical protein
MSKEYKIIEVYPEDDQEMSNEEDEDEKSYSQAVNMSFPISKLIKYNL